MAQLLAMVFGYVLLLLGGIVALSNWYTPIASFRSKRNVSMVPLVGAALLGTGIYVITSSIWWSLLAIFLDLGTLVFVLVLPNIIYDVWATSRYNLVHEFHSAQQFRNVSLRLYRNNTACFKLSIDKESVPSGYSLGSVIIGLVGKWEPCSDGFRIYNYGDGRELLLTASGETFNCIESDLSNSSSADSRMDGLEFVKSVC